MTAREHTLWLRCLRYMGDLLRQQGRCGRGWPVSVCGEPAGHPGRCPEPSL